MKSAGKTNNLTAQVLANLNLQYNWADADDQDKNTAPNESKQDTFAFSDGVRLAIHENGNLHPSRYEHLSAHELKKMHAPQTHGAFDNRHKKTVLKAKRNRPKLPEKEVFADDARSMLAMLLDAGYNDLNGKGQIRESFLETHNIKTPAELRAAIAAAAGLNDRTVLTLNFTSIEHLTDPYAALLRPPTDESQDNFKFFFEFLFAVLSDPKNIPELSPELVKQYQFLRFNLLMLSPAIFIEKNIGSETGREHV